MPRAGPILILLSLAAGSARADEVPDWLAAVAAAPAGVDTTRAVILIDEQSVRLSSSGRVITTERHAVRILRGDGRKDAVAVIPYDSESGRVRSMAAWIVPPRGSGYEIPSSRQIDQARIGDDVYSQLRIRILAAGEDAVPGVVFGYEWSNEGMDVCSQFQWMFQSDLPCRISRFSLELPSGWATRDTVFHHAPVAARRDRGAYVWELRDVPAISDEPAGPPLGSSAARLAVSGVPEAGARSRDIAHFSTWGEVARWVDELMAPVRAASPEVVALSSAVVRGARTELDTVRAVARRVQRLRYASIPLGLGSGGGYRPNPPGTTLYRGYGDCKDKANLMRAMLSSLGVDAYLVTVYSGDAYQAEERWPALGAFNHCIVGIRTRDPRWLPASVRDSTLGPLLLFDPTDPFVALGDLPESDQGSIALVIAPGTRAPVRAPRIVDNSRWERRVTLVLAEDGSLTGRLEDRASGQMANGLRRLLYRGGSRDRRDAFEQWLNRSVGSARVTGLDTADDSLANLATARLSFELSAYGQRQSHLLTFRPFLLSSMYGPLAAVSEPRRQPIDLPGLAFRETLLVRLPEGFAAEDLPQPLALEAGFGSYSSTVRKAGTSLELTRALEVRAERLPAERSAEVGGFFRAIRKFEESPVVLAPY